MYFSVRRFIHPVTIQLTKTRVPHQITTQNEAYRSSQGPAIYAVNHTNSCDIPISCRAIQKHCLVLIGKQRLYLSDRLFFFLNGAIWVDRKNKQNMHLAKMRIQKHLSSGKSLIWFPEGTWNLSDNLLMLPMKWGIIDCAKQCHVPIIPVVLEYKQENRECIARFGEHLDPDNLSLREGIDVLRDRMAELRLLVWEQKGVENRSKINPNEERRKMFRAVDDYPPLDLEYEKSIIFDPLSGEKVE